MWNTQAGLQEINPQSKKIVFLLYSAYHGISSVKDATPLLPRTQLIISVFLCSGWHTRNEKHVMHRNQNPLTPHLHSSVQATTQHRWSFTGGDLSVLSLYLHFFPSNNWGKNRSVSAMSTDSQRSSTHPHRKGKKEAKSLFAKQEIWLRNSVCTSE